MANTDNGGCIDTSTFYDTVYQRLPDIQEMVKQEAQDHPSYPEWMVPTGRPMHSYEDGRFLVKRGAGSQIIPSQELDLTKEYGDDGCEISTSEKNVRVGQGGCSALGCNEISARTTDLNGQCGSTRHIIESGSGHFRRYPSDREIKAGTDVKCLNVLEGVSPENQLDILSNEIDTLRDSLRRSKEFDMIKYIAETAESNFVCTGRNNVAGARPKFTGPNGWEKADPNDVDHVTIFHLLEVREHIAAQKLSHGKIRSIDDFLLKVVMTRESWDQAVMRYEQVMESSQALYRNNDVYAQTSLARYQKTTRNMKEMQVGANKRQTEVFNGKLQIFFTDNPLKAYQVPDGQFPDGTPRCRYEPVPRFIDVDARTVYGPEARGVIQVENRQWRENEYICGGVKYELFEALVIIDEESWRKHPLLRGRRPNGVTSTPVDLSIQLKHGDSIPPITGCPNEDDTQYYYFAQMWCRYINRYPEFSGIGWHRPVRMLGFNSGLTPTPTNYGQDRAEATTALADAESCKESAPCDQEQCPEDAVDCTVADNTTALDPCGDLNAPFFGGDSDDVVVLKVCRDKDCAEVADAKVDFAITPVPANPDECVVESVYGTDYVAIDADGNVLPDSGSIDFAAGESGCKEICIKLLAAADTIAAADPEGPCCEGNEDKEQFKQFSVKLTEASGTTLETCTESIVTVENATGADPVPAE